VENLKINYIDWWDDGRDFVFSQILRQKYNLIFSNPNECDIVFTGPFNDMRLKDLVSSYKIHYTGENSRNPNNIDFSLNYNLDSDYRLPIYYVMSNEKTFIDKTPSPILLENRIKGKRNKFCGFLVSNPSNQIRNQSFIEVSKYKHVESGGMVFNNIGFKVYNTHEWMSQYKFFICFENSKYDYYITEKLINAYYSGCIPIYWGSDTVDSELNEDCMINVNKMRSYEELVDKIKEIDNNDILYRKMLSEPLLKNNVYDEKYSSYGLLGTFDFIIKKAKERK
jgi:hypothetical protein